MRCEVTNGRISKSLNQKNSYKILLLFHPVTWFYHYYDWSYSKNKFVTFTGITRYNFVYLSICLMSSHHRIRSTSIVAMTSRVFFRVWMLIVSVSSWFWVRLVAPRRSHFLPSPLLYFFSFNTSMVWEGRYYSVVIVPVCERGDDSGRVQRNSLP